MMFVSPKLNVVLATCHIPLMNIRNELTIGKVYDAIDLAHQGCIKLGIQKPRIAVTGLNPHAGENGMLGDEEQRLIMPALRLAKDSGIHSSGPYPADTAFNSAIEGKFDVVVAMYHDQGLAPFKALSFGRGVNFTAGLPIVRTSPDHGTGFDIAGKNEASADSIRSAIFLATDIRRNRLNFRDISSNPLKTAPPKRDYRDSRR